jgi:hypothetical protein
MKISELIEELERLKDEHGDLEVKIHAGYTFNGLEIEDVDKSDAENCISILV